MRQCWRDTLGCGSASAFAGAAYEDLGVGQFNLQAEHHAADHDQSRAALSGLVAPGLQHGGAIGVGVLILAQKAVPTRSGQL
jgi:hypothetical protein